MLDVIGDAAEKIAKGTKNLSLDTGLTQLKEWQKTISDIYFSDVFQWILNKDLKVKGADVIVEAMAQLNELVNAKELLKC